MKKLFVPILVLAILFPNSLAFGICIFGKGSHHTEGRVIVKKLSFKDDKNFSTNLRDSSGNNVPDVKYELSANLLELQSICRKNDSRLGYGIAVTGAIPLLVKEPNATFETTNSKTSFKDVLINYYGASIVGDANLLGGIPRSNLQFGFTATGKFGWEFITGRYDYTYENGNLQTDEMKNFNGPFLEIFLGLKLNVFDDNKDIQSVLLGTNQHIASGAEVDTKYELGYTFLY